MSIGELLLLLRHSRKIPLRDVSGAVRQRMKKAALYGRPELFWGGADGAAGSDAAAANAAVF
jgi:hypothetical protein